MKCPKGCDITEAIVCGGSLPYANHGMTDPDELNIYFYVNIETGKMLHKVFSTIPFNLTNEDWEDMHDHAGGGCCDEMQCPNCLEYLE